MNYVSTKDVHDQEIKVRLTEENADLLKAAARKMGMPPAVLARVLIKRELDRQFQAAPMAL